jgi:hypothetical protein
VVAHCLYPFVDPVGEGTSGPSAVFLVGIERHLFGKHFEEDHA